MCSSASTVYLKSPPLPSWTNRVPFTWHAPALAGTFFVNFDVTLRSVFAFGLAPGESFMPADERCPPSPDDARRQPLVGAASQLVEKLFLANPSDQTFGALGYLLRTWVPGAARSTRVTP